VKICGEDIKVEGTLIRIARLDGEQYKFLNDPEAVLDGLRKSETRVDLFTFLQKLPETSPKFSYPMELDSFAVLPITTFDEWFRQTINKKVRNMIRKAGKSGVAVREAPFDDTLVRGIFEIYSECPIRQGKPFVHYGMEIETVRQHAGTFLDASVFIGAFLGDKLIGFAKLTTDETRTQAGLMHIVSMIQHRDKAPTNALIAQAVRSCAERGIPYLVYSKFSRPKKQGDSLSEFKEHNGFQRVDLPRYYVPLTRSGWAAFRLGLHHSFVDRVPEPVLARLREIRNGWYSRRFNRLTEA